MQGDSCRGFSSCPPLPAEQCHAGAARAELVAAEMLLSDQYGGCRCWSKTRENELGKEQASDWDDVFVLNQDVYV